MRATIKDASNPGGAGSEVEIMRVTRPPVNLGTLGRLSIRSRNGYTARAWRENSRALRTQSASEMPPID